ncbi:Interferon-induced very large GTPase 1 [Oopsacas minuta]|uniref:Interferon-induced very large GTPase 1 n=1 Tax=Oopsacas minuta TaxID=111878 RepID=A0AAV7KF30_9METZ|nr:Interferon-induced very large GTPase 1 [Oopsacas minuta]
MARRLERPPDLELLPVNRSELKRTLSSLNLGDEKTEFILEHGEKFIDKPELLSVRLEITLDTAEEITEALKISRQVNTSGLTKEMANEIDRCSKMNVVKSPLDIALLLDLDEGIVTAYLNSKSLNDRQKRAINEKYRKGYSIRDIVDQLKLPHRKVLEYVEGTYLEFTGREGRKVLELILKNSQEVTVERIREKIICKDLKLQDQLMCVLKQKNESEYTQIITYLHKFSESRNFSNVDTHLSLDDIFFINQSVLSINLLSIQLNKVETVIRNFVQRYAPLEIEENGYKNLQLVKVAEIAHNFGTDTKTFHTYRMIVTDSIESMIQSAKSIKSQNIIHKPKEIFKKLLPLTFYYLKCSLPFEDITRIIAETCQITFTTHDVFHIIFQLSDPVLRGFCVEHYSFSNPVPLYYPKLDASINKQRTECKFEICSELWYSIQEYDGLISFGLGRAGWDPFGKSHLLDMIFETDFAKGNPRNSAFHKNSIDIQMTNNLFAAVGDSSSYESTKWAYIDCNGYADMRVVHAICEHLEIAIIHVSHFDFTRYRPQIMMDINKFKYVKHLYIFVRDCEKYEVQVDEKKSCIFIPNLVQNDKTLFYSSLKKIGYEILHLKPKKKIGREMIESLIGKFKAPSLKEIQSDYEHIQTMMSNIMQNKKSETLDFSFLNYYPLFIVYMELYYLASNETKREMIIKHDKNRVIFKEHLDKMEIGNIVHCFNEILERKNSILILWKLSRELSVLTNKITRSNEGRKVVKLKNDKYNLEILWREALLSSKFGKDCQIRKNFGEKFSLNFSNYVERGEVFELIDGDNLRYFNQDINALLANLYRKQIKTLKNTPKNKIEMRQAPIVVSIFGPQSSGKSTLLNYCFGCKFLTSAGRCTRGIYASLSQLSQPVNCTEQFLILDTEGLDASEKRDSLKHFDRTMVLFCLAVSQVVIINLKTDIGEVMQNLLQICAYSLHKLKVSKVVAPKVFFVLNQQADPDPEKHLGAINILLEKLNTESDLMMTEGIKISDLIQVSRKNLFILPSAFNSQQINRPAANLFDSEVIKHSPTQTFAKACEKLRLSIINQLISMPQDERAPFKTMSEWVEMSGVIWEIIVKYQDIVKHKNVEEMMCHNRLGMIVTDLIKKHISDHHNEFDKSADQIITDIKNIDKPFHKTFVLDEKMEIFDDLYCEHQEECYNEYRKICQSDALLCNMYHICEEVKSNLSRLLYIERKYYQDKIQFQIKACWAELNRSHLMGNFQIAINENLDDNLELNEKEQQKAFEETWLRCFGDEDLKEERTERDEDFDNLYSIFKMESKMMENKQTIFKLLSSSNFEMDKVIQSLRMEMLMNFENYVESFSAEENYFFPWKENILPMKDMVPFTGRDYCEYLKEDSLYTSAKKNLFGTQTILTINHWIPKECHDLIQCCSGYSNHADITWKTEERKQILLLASVLKDPDNPRVSTWSKLLHNISSTVESLLKRDPHIPKGTVRELMNYLSTTFKHVNYEINYIQAKLTNKAEMTITTFVFAYAFKHLWETKMKRRNQYNLEKEREKSKLLDYFFQKVKSRTLARGNWDRKEMRKIDQRIANKFSLDFLERVKRGVMTDGKQFIENKLMQRKDDLSHKALFLLIDELITKELNLNPGVEVLNQNNIVIQFTCNRNELIKKIFHSRWDEILAQVYDELVDYMKSTFLEQLKLIKAAIANFLENILSINSEGIAFDSDTNFELADRETYEEHISEPKLRESPLKANALYLEMYFNPNVTPEEFKTFFQDTFEVNGIKMLKRQRYWSLCDKPEDLNIRLDKYTFKKLQYTKMFNSENIYNAYSYMREFLSTLNCYEYEMTMNEFRKIVRYLEDEYEALIVSCPAKCPSCGKLCERELHMHGEKCQIKTGHQICSMGGKVWRIDEDKTAVLITCDDYRESTEVKIPGKNMKWSVFKEQTGNEWDWTKVQSDEDYRTLQENNREKMMRIWNKFGRGILNYHAKTGTKITYIPYVSFEKVLKTVGIFDFRICFVIDGTGSMANDIDRARISVGQLISKYKKGHKSVFAIVIYRDHCDGEDLIEMFPVDSRFTINHQSVQNFLEGVKVFGGGDGPEAVLDGLAMAINKFTHSDNIWLRNMIIHIFDSPPHGDFPNYKSHSAGSDKQNCCCCNKGGLCEFEWESDVWDTIRELKIEYNGINTGSEFPEFTETMKEHLEENFGSIQTVEKHMVNDAVYQIFIDYEA